MAYHIINTNTATAVNDMDFDTVEAALEFARAPAWAGAAPTEITVIGADAYKHMGIIYKVTAGENPRKLRAQESAKAAAASQRRSAFNAQGKFRGSGWLAREMDREDSDF